MRVRTFSLLTGASVAALACATAYAQSSTTGTESASAAFELEEIIVTARRKTENLQDAPLVVDAVTSESIEKLNILNFADVQSLTPGLTLQGGSTGYSTTASMRGVSYTVESANTSTVAMYLNDAPVQSNILFQSMYDVGQIEVLRGPQGTTRGQAAPSGAITLTTRKPNLSEFGGYVSGTATNQNAKNAQGALNLPVISDVLAVRLAGVYDDNELDGIRSVHNSMDPDQKTRSERISVRFDPNDALSANVMYQHLTKDLTAFNAVSGIGHTNQSATEPPTGYNGPVINPTDRLGITDGARSVSQTLNEFTGQVDWRFAGQKVSYVGAYYSLDFTANAPSDKGNLVPGFEFYQQIVTTSDAMTHELRLASEERIAGLFDYTVGAFYSRNRAVVTGQVARQYLGGAFGTPAAAPVPATPNDRFMLPIGINNPDTLQQEKSVFASLTWHINDNIELTGGARHILSTYHSTNQLLIGSGFIARSWPLPGSICTAAPPNGAGGQYQATYPGVCDIPIAASTQTNLVDNYKNPTIYNVVFSYHFNDDWMVYANTGSAWRPGDTTVGISSTNVATDPVMHSLVFHEPEKSVSYEVGFKSTFLDKRARVNLALYRQKFDGYFFYTPQAINYVSTTTGSRDTRGSGNFTANVNAITQGADLETAFQITPHWSASLNASYANGKVDHDYIPCNDTDLDGVPDNNAQTETQFLNVMSAAGKAIALCKSSASLSTNPKWNTSFQSEYSIPVIQSMDAFVRGLWTYYPKNDQSQAGGITVSAYSLVNLYLGVRDPSGAWEVSLFGKNITNTSKALSGSTTEISGASGLGGFFGNTGYSEITSLTPRREFGATVRYAFGSR